MWFVVATKQAADDKKPNQLGNVCNRVEGNDGNKARESGCGIDKILCFNTSLETSATELKAPTRGTGRESGCGINKIL